MESKAFFFLVAHMGDCDELLQELHGSAIFPRFENGNSGTSKCSNILPSFCHGFFRIGLGCVLWEVSLRVLATLHSANCGVLLFLIVYFKGGCFLFLEKVLGHIYDHPKLALCANLHNIFIMYTHMKIKKYSHFPCHATCPLCLPYKGILKSSNSL